MTILRAFAIIIASGIIFALGGATIGYLLGTNLPDYYRGVFQKGNDPHFHPVSVGLGLGISQGFIVGLIAGAIVVLSVAWYNGRRR